MKRLILALAFCSGICWGQLRWSVTSAPAAGTAASAVQAASTVSYHVADCIGFSANSVIAPALTSTNVLLSDGATVLAAWVITIPAATGTIGPIQICDLSIKGTVGNSMSLTWGANVTNLQMEAWIIGHDGR